MVDDTGFHLSVGATGEDAVACRLRLDAASVTYAYAEITAHAAGARITWVIGGSATPGDLPDQLRALGCREQEWPLTSFVTALATTAEPPAVHGVEVRRIESFDDFLVGHEVAIAGWSLPSEQAERARVSARATYARRSARAGGEWLALLDGVPVGYAGAVAGRRGLFLTGGVTLPRARGRGVYRALVAERWREAVRRGTPALVIHAEESSRPIVERLGFERVCPIVELLSG